MTHHRATCWTRILSALVGGLCCLGQAPAAGETPDWQVKQTLKLDGLNVSVSQPVRVAERRDYLWFPTLVRLANGELLAMLNDYADEVPESSTGRATWSRDGGLTWSPPIRTLYSDSHVTLPDGDCLLLPYYLRACATNDLCDNYQLCPRGARRLELRDGIRVSGWPRMMKAPDPKFHWGGFVINGQTVPLAKGGTLATLYGNFAGERRYSLVTANSIDGVNWTVRSLVAGADCPLKGEEGPCEAALCRLKDGRLMCVFRLSSGVPLGQSYSADEGRTWSAPVAMAGPYSVQPSLAVLADGALALSSGRPGISIWLNAGGDGRRWQAIDLVKHHNACRPDQPVKGTSSYTETVVLDRDHLLCIYDLIPEGWNRNPLPTKAPDNNSVWVVRLTVTRS